MKRHTLRISILAIAVILAASGPTGAADTYGSFDETYGDDYQSGDLARLTSAESGVTIVRGHADDGGTPDEGTANTPVFAGDTLKTAVDQRVELQLADGSLVRLDQSSDLRVQALPDPYAEFKDNTVLALREGTVQIIADVRDDETFRIDTTGATIYLTGSGDYRIDATRDGRTRVYSRQGVAEVAGDGGSVLVRAGQMTEARPGAYPATAEPFNTLQADAFDRWTADLDRVWQAQQQPTDRSSAGEAAYEDVPGEVRPYYRELSNNGRWVYVEDYGWSWYPVGVEAGWRPYVDGGWTYGPNGYFWVSSEPWGWAPYHYGRWSHVPAYGWIWSPGRVFAGAWVSWSWGSSYIGWCPINYWNRPVHYGSTYWGYYGSNCWTFVHYSHFSAHNYRRYAVPVDRIGGDLDGRAISSRPPRVDPRSVRTDAGARRDAMRQTREGRPALDRGIDRRAGDTAADERGRFRDMEDRFVQRGARADRVSSLRDNGRRAPAANERSAPGRDDSRAGGATTGAANGRADARAGSGAGARGDRASSRQTANGVGDDLRTRPRQIRPDPGTRDDRVRDMYQRIQRTDDGTRSSNATRDERSSDPRSSAERRSTTTRERRVTAPTRSTQSGSRTSTTPVRPQRRNTTAGAAPDSSARSTGSSRSGRDTGNAVRPAPTRRPSTADRQTAPARRGGTSASPGRSSGSQRSASPGRSSGGSPSASPGRSSGPSRSASPGKSSGGSQSASPGRPSGPSRSASPGKSSGGSPSASPSRSSGSKGSQAGRSGKKGGT